MKILNFGSLNIDYVYNVPHFVSAGETLSTIKREIFSGGKGLNQSIALARAGAEVYHAGCAGLSDGDMLVDLLLKNKVDISYIRRSQTATGHAIIQVDGNGQNCILIYGGANKEITEEQIENTLNHFSDGDMLLLQNEINCLGELMKQAKSRGIKIAFNPSPIDHELSGLPLNLVDIFLVNEVEAAALSGCQDEAKQLSTMQEKFPNARILMTLGGTGSIYGDKKEVLRCGTFRTRVVDTTAAGDTYTGYFLASLATGNSIEKAMRRAAKAASLAVSVKGAAASIPTADEVDQQEFEYLPMKK